MIGGFLYNIGVVVAEIEDSIKYLEKYKIELEMK